MIEKVRGQGAHTSVHSMVRRLGRMFNHAVGLLSQPLTGERLSAGDVAWANMFIYSRTISMHLHTEKFELLIVPLLRLRLFKC